MSEVNVQAQKMSDDGEESCCVNFYFMDSEDSKNGTGVHGGQIPEIMFFL